MSVGNFRHFRLHTYSGPTEKQSVNGCLKGLSKPNKKIHGSFRKPRKVDFKSGCPDECLRMGKTGIHTHI